MYNRFKNFTVLLNKINRNIRRIKTIVMKEYDLKSPHVSCLYYLYSEGSITIKELKELCDEDKAAISRTIDFLEKNGYIVQKSEDNKKYKNLLELTPMGEKVGEYISNNINKYLEEASIGLSEENRVILYSSLELISDNLSKIVEK